MSLLTITFLIGAALANIFGAWLFLLRRQWEDEKLRFLIASGAGFLLAVSLLEMLPHASRLSPHAPFWAIVGFIIVHVAEHIVPAHFHYGDETHTGLNSQVGVFATSGLALHSLIDGAAIVAAVQSNSWLGGLVFVAMVWHRIPAGFTVASIMRAAGGSSRRSMGASVVLGIAAIAGGVIYLAVSQSVGIELALALSAGSLLYVAATDLLPEVNRRRTLWAPIGVLIGVGVYYLTHFISGH